MGRSMLVLSGVITFLDGILLAHVLAVFRLSVEAGAQKQRKRPRLTLQLNGRGHDYDCADQCC